MTEMEKTAIERMRRSGLSYQEIAGNLAISKDAVRSYCRTHDIAPDTDIRRDTGVCPVCGKPLTIGVANRVYELSDRKGDVTPPPTAGKVISLVPLPEILSEIMQVGPSSKSVTAEYENLINKLGPELSILTSVPVEEIEKVHSPILAEGISRLRKGQVIRQSGYDGEYGIIKLFNEDEIVKKTPLI